MYKLPILENNIILKNSIYKKHNDGVGLTCHCAFFYHAIIILEFSKKSSLKNKGTIETKRDRQIILDIAQPFYRGNRGQVLNT